MTKLLSCGVIISDGRLILLGHTTRSSRWDIPKGIAGPGEDPAAAAARELKEETGLVVPVESLRKIGVYPYVPAKDLALFAWEPAEMPALERLHCGSVFEVKPGTILPEFDRFGVFAWSDALGRVGKNLARVLANAQQALSRTLG